MTTSASWPLLCPDLIELQLGQIDLLSAMYPDTITLEETSQRSIDVIRKFLEGDRSDKADAAPFIPLSLQIPISSASGSEMLGLDLVVPFTWEGNEEPVDPPKVKVRVRPPSWLSRAVTNELMVDLPEDEDLLGIIEYIKEAAAQQLAQATTTSVKSKSQNETAMNAGPLIRVWFYFPSISTRSKRDDFIKYAPSYSLTGFLYAGKPGLLCLEGVQGSIDDFMRFIKTESWSDIPASHKKVSERYREIGGVERVFREMTEITNVVGERRGQKANRGDMKALEEWLVEMGLGEAFEKVLM